MCTRVRRSLTPAGVFQVHVVEYDEEEETINCENVYRHGYAHSAPSHSLSLSLQRSICTPVRPRLPAVSGLLVTLPLSHTVAQCWGGVGYCAMPRG